MVAIHVGRNAHQHGCPPIAVRQRSISACENCCCRATSSSRFDSSSLRSASCSRNACRSATSMRRTSCRDSTLAIDDHPLVLLHAVRALAPGRLGVGVVEHDDRSRRRKSDPFRSAMSMLTFYINRAGKQLSRVRRKRLEAAKDELRDLYGRPRQKAA